MVVLYAFYWREGFICFNYNNSIWSSFLLEQEHGAAFSETVLLGCLLLSNYSALALLLNSSFSFVFPLQGDQRPFEGRDCILQCPVLKLLGLQ